jgi:hypothetical protein
VKGLTAVRIWAGLRRLLLHGPSCQIRSLVRMSDLDVYVWTTEGLTIGRGPFNVWGHVASVHTCVDGEKCFVCCVNERLGSIPQLGSVLGQGSSSSDAAVAIAASAKTIARMKCMLCEVGRGYYECCWLLGALL